MAETAEELKARLDAKVARRAEQVKNRVIATEISIERREALESVVGRPLTKADLKAILPLLADPENRNDVAIAAVLSQGRTRLASHSIGLAELMAHCGSNFLAALESDSSTDARWVLQLGASRQLDVGLPGIRSILEGFAAKWPQHVDGLRAILALGTVPDPVNLGQLSHALNLAEGRRSML